MGLKWESLLPRRLNLRLLTQGNAFTGCERGSWFPDGQKELINGVIGEKDSIYISEEDGYTVGRIRSNGDIWLVYLEESKDDSSAKDSIIKKIN